MSGLIRDCVSNLSDQMSRLTESDGKVDSKLYITLKNHSFLPFFNSFYFLMIECTACLVPTPWT